MSNLAIDHRRTARQAADLYEFEPELHVFELLIACKEGKELTWESMEEVRKINWQDFRCNFLESEKASEMLELMENGDEIAAGRLYDKWVTKQAIIDIRQALTDYGYLPKGF